MHSLNFAIFTFLFYIGASSPVQDGKNIYAVIIDAGSTGSRVVGYEFQKKGTDFELLREKFERTKPGLSNFAGKPQAGADDIMKLLNRIDDFVPDEEKPKTILYLRATAGLRLLKEKDAKDLLCAVQKSFKETKYKVSKDAADMLSGSDEGILSWFTVNYLKDSLKKNQTLATLEMGGGSAQVTYEPASDLLSQLKGYMHPTPKKELIVFSHSYLGLGLKAGRQGILQLDHQTELADGDVVSSTCFNSENEPSTFDFNNMNITVKGKPENKGVDVKKCKATVAKFIGEKVKPKPLGFDKETPVALSAFYYRANSSALIGGEGGSTNLKEIGQRVEKNCATKNDQDPFLCMDLIFIHSLLTDGFGIKEDHPIQIFRNIDNHELSWALGFAYSKLIEQEKIKK